jgi:predicted amidophosphoribosyltransferase
LVDDIATTGSHLIAARDALKLAGVGVFAVAWIGG